MQADLLERLFDSTADPGQLLGGWNLREPERGVRNLRALSRNLRAPGLAELLVPLQKIVPRLSDPDMALNNLERFLAQPAGRERLHGLLDGRSRGLEILLQLLSTSQFFADHLVANPEDFDVARQPLRRIPTRAELTDELRANVAEAGDDARILRAIRRFRQKQHLRIGVNDVVRDRPLEEITLDLSNVADACLEVALQVALAKFEDRFGSPRTEEGKPARCSILGFGKLGGCELNYSSDIDLMFLFDDEGTTEGRRSAMTNGEFYSRTAAEVVRLLSAHTDRGSAYRVDLRLRPEGVNGPLAHSLPAALSYYDTLGRTWERQALIKVRPVAGDAALGAEFLAAVEPFVYRRYLAFAEINEIKAVKRRIEQFATKRGQSEREVKTGSGGIRDIEFTIQFLQLLNGGDPEMQRVRKRSTLAAMRELEAVGCLTDPELRALDDGYRFLRKAEHRLQLLFDLQTHLLPENEHELHKLALRMGYVNSVPAPAEPLKAEEDETPPSDPRGVAAQRVSPLDEAIEPALDTRQLLQEPLEHFLHDYREKTRLNRTILDHLLHQTFADSDTQAEPESDLILAADADEATVRAALARYPFRDVLAAHRNLLQLAQESVPFLSTRRCRHFLASIAPQLLRALAETADPDSALLNLEKVTASLGAKAVLWELFSFHPPSLHLCVDICANSSFLSEILVSNPGMIDDLLDSLILNQPRRAAELAAELAELGRGVESDEIDGQIVRSFQDKELLRIGVRDLLGKANIRETVSALSDVADAVLAHVVSRQERETIARFGAPRLDADAAPCRYALLALGKLGGREMSYRSDLDLLLVYEGDGRTLKTDGRDDGVDNEQFFTELVQRIIRFCGDVGPHGKLYSVDMKLRPAGKSGSLVVPLAEFSRYYESDRALIWERQSLTRARFLCGDASFGSTVLAAVNTAIDRPWRSCNADEILAMRLRLEQSASPRSLKRAVGSVMDTEFAVQLLQLKYGATHPGIRQANVWEALTALAEAGLLTAGEASDLAEGYSFHRFAEARLRIVTNRPINEYPEDRGELEKFARRMGLAAGETGSADTFLLERTRHAKRTREIFLSIVERERSEEPPRH